MQDKGISKEIFKSIILLGFIQLIRIALISCAVIRGTSNIRTAVAEICIILCLVALLLYMAKKEKVKFSLFLISNNINFVMIYSLLSVIIIFTVMTMPAFTCGFGLSIFIPFLYAVVVIPVFEELLFRGYFWNKFDKFITQRYKILLLVVGLSVFWFVTSIGRLDLFSNSIFGVTGATKFILSRAAMGAVYGGILGIVRIVSKNTFACILCHAIMNMLLILI